MSSDGIKNLMAPVYEAAVRDVRYHSVACLTSLVWHCALTFNQDVQYIWTMRNKNPLKWLYFFLRYAVILACVMHNWLIGQLADGSNPPTLCKIWQAYIRGFAQSLASSLELVLAIRIIALYNRSRKVTFLLLILIVVELGGTVRLLWSRENSAFYQTCLLRQHTKDGWYQGILVFAVHCVLVGLTLFKYFFALRTGWGRSPLVSLVVRDGSMMFAMITFILLSLLVLCNLGNEKEVALFFWVVSLFSVTGCTMIRSMERFARQEISIEQPILTSRISMPIIESGSQDRLRAPW